MLVVVPDAPVSVDRIMFAEADNRRKKDGKCPVVKPRRIGQRGASV